MYSSGVTSRYNTKVEIKQNYRRRRTKGFKYMIQNDVKNLNNSLYLNSRIRLNISGRIFEVPEIVLNRYPLSLLGSYQERIQYYDHLRDEFFFDRNREAFEGVIQFYQTCGVVDIPIFVPLDVFYEELKYFKLDLYLNSNSNCDEMLLVTALKSEIKSIKKQIKISSIGPHKIIDENLKQRIRNLRKRFHRFKYYFEDDDDLNFEDADSLPKNKFQRNLYILLEKPSSNIMGQIVAFFGLIVVILSVVVMCLETVVDSKNRLNINADDFELNERNVVFFLLELFCNTIFTIEITLRFIAAPNKYLFIKNFSNLIDLIAILPFWTILLLNNNTFMNFINILNVQNQNKKRQKNQYALSVLRILRLTRVLRVLKLSRHIQILNVMGKILYECIYEIILLLTFLTINIVIFSSLIYLIEYETLGENSPFISIPHSFWWAIISFTTIGYGDLIPQSNVGKFFGSFFILCGILIALLPVPILSCKFEKIYKECSHENRKTTSDD